MTDPLPDILIAGGGLAGSLAALALAERRPDLSVLLVEQGANLGGQHVWSFFDTDFDAACHRLLKPLVTRHWANHDIAFPARRRTIEIGYNSVRSVQLDTLVRKRLGSKGIRLTFELATVASDHVVGINGERIDARLVLDARGPTATPGLNLGWQKFVGRTYQFSHPHGLVRPMVMDATIAQRDGYRFTYLLPFSENEALIEDTYYSDDPHIDRDRLGAELDGIARGLGEARITEQETGVLPVVIDGDVATLWKDTPAPLLGIRGGFFHPTTGYSLPDAARNALLLADQADFRPAAIHALLRGRAEQLWRDRHFFQLLNRMLFRGARPDERYRVLQHFYRLPDATIGRFYAANLNFVDKVRILSGKPPVPIARALRVLRRAA